LRRRVLALSLLALVVAAVLVVGGLWARSRRRPPPAPVLMPPTLPEPANNAWPTLIRAATALDARSDEIDEAADRPWSEGSRETQRLLRDCGRDLKTAREALAQECLQPRPKDIAQLFPEPRSLRNLSGLLVVAGRERERGRDADGAAAAYADVLRVGTAVGRNGMVIHGLVGVAITAMAAADLERCVGSGGMTEKALARTARELDRAVAEGVKPDEAMAVEYVLQRKCLNDMAAGLQPPSGRGARKWIVGAFLVEPARRELDRNIGPTLETLRTPYWQPVPSPPVYKTTLCQMFTVQPQGLRRKWAQRDAVLAGLQAHVACQRYRLRHHALPPTLQALAPAFLQVVPTDPFDGKPLKYRCAGGAYVLYSVAEDGKDDGGTERFDTEAKRGDLIIWPWGRLTKPRPQANPPAPAVPNTSP